MLKGYRTLFFSIAIMLLGFLQSTDFNNFLSQYHLSGNAELTLAIGAITAFLRFATTTPIGKVETPHIDGK